MSKANNCISADLISRGDWCLRLMKTTAKYNKNPSHASAKGWNKKAWSILPP